MTHTISVDDEVFGRLQERAEPLVDTPNSVIRRLLGMGGDPTDARDRPTPGSNSSRAARGELLPEREYELPILRYLDDMGGRAPLRDVVAAVGQTLAGRLTPRDRERVKSGDVRWQNRVEFTRLRLAERGELAKGSPRGIWEITDEGRRRVRAEQ